MPTPPTEHQHKESWPLVSGRACPKGRRHVTDHTPFFGEGGAQSPKQPRPVTAPPLIHQKRRQKTQPAPLRQESAKGEAQERHRAGRSKANEARRARCQDLVGPPGLRAPSNKLHKTPSTRGRTHTARARCNTGMFKVHPMQDRMRSEAKQCKCRGLLAASNRAAADNLLIGMQQPRKGYTNMLCPPHPLSTNTKKVGLW